LQRITITIIYEDFETKYADEFSSLYTFSIMFYLLKKTRGIILSKRRLRTVEKNLKADKNDTTEYGVGASVA
jgi:hypothetical protein